MKRRNLILANLILFIFLIVFFFSLHHIVFWYQDNQKTDEQIKKLQNIVKINEPKNSITTELLDDSKYSNVDLLSIDFTNLLTINEEIVGWIEIPNTNINYPFVKHSDNSYYLTHSFDKSYNNAGWLFLDYRNKIDNIDTNTIIYAHGRVDGTMFGSLKDVLTNDWLNKEQYYIRVSTLSYNYLFEIFSAYHIKTTNDYLETNFSNEEEYSNFLNTIQSRSMISLNTRVSSKNKIITLSTCYNNSEKMVVHAKLIKQEKRS